LALVNTATKTITLAGNPFTNGQTVSYFSPSGVTLGGLVPNTNYQVLTSGDTFQLKDLATSQIVSLSLPAGPSFQVLDYMAAGTITVTTPDTPIGGLRNDHAYYVTVVDANTIRLTNNLVDAFNAQPIQFTGLGDGNSDQIVIGATTAGI